ncbi:MAG: phosphatidylserine decarboxylase [bacterium]
MVDAHSRLIDTPSRRSSFVERLADIAGINRFFLRPGSPPAVSTDPRILVSPAHSKVAWVGTVDRDGFLPAKPVLGQQRLWTLSQVLWDEALAESFGHSLVFNLYLSPLNLHYVVAPVTGRVESVRRCPGRCWPIVFWKLGEVENERVVVVLRLEDGRRLAMVLVGSFLVSGILFLPEPGDTIRKGEVVGGFKIGSTVFVVIESGQGTELVEAGDPLLIGEPLARFL